MTCIAWDGHTLAADRLAVVGDRRATAKKLFPLGSGEVAAICGDHHEGLMLVQWYKDGADPEKWPAFQSEGDYTTLVVASRGRGVKVFGKLPVAIQLSDKIFAWGSGGEAAMGAMHFGATAEQAVRAAIKVNAWCGNGVDKFKVK